MAHHFPVGKLLPVLPTGDSLGEKQFQMITFHHKTKGATSG